MKTSLCCSSAASCCLFSSRSCSGGSCSAASFFWWSGAALTGWDSWSAVLACLLSESCLAFSCFSTGLPSEPVPAFFLPFPAPHIHPVLEGSAHAYIGGGLVLGYGLRMILYSMFVWWRNMI